MNTSLSFFYNLLISSAMAVILGCLIIFTKWIFKNRLSPKYHYYIWLLLIIKLLIPHMPENPFSIFNLIEPSFQKTLSIRDSLMDSFENFNKKEVTAKVFGEDKVSEHVSNDDAEIGSKVSKEEISGQDDNAAVNESAYEEIKSKPISPMNIAFLIWLSGSFVLILYIGYTNIKFNNLIKQYIGCDDERLNTILKMCSQKAGVSREIPIFVTHETRTPSLYGIIKPKILIPSDFLDNLDENELKYVFFHELSHYKSKDIILNWVMVMLQVIHWFNPFIWYAFYLMRQDCEIACDAEVLSWIKPEERRQYGQTIINLLKIFSESKFIPSSAGITQNKHNIKRRIIMINMFKKKTVLNTVVSIAIITIVGLIGLTGTKPSIYAETKVMNQAGNNEQIHFSDSTLAAAIAKAVGKPEGSLITKADVEGIKQMYVGSPANLEGIEYLTNLEELRFAHSSITDYKPLIKLKNFKSIWFLESKTDIDLNSLKELSKLESLRIDGCKVKDMQELSGLSNLKYLSLARFKTPIDLTPLIGLTKFESLSISEAKIADLKAISDLKNLKSLHLLLYVPDLKFTESLTKLESLYINTDDIKSLPKLKNLKDLDIGFNSRKADISIIGTLKNLESLSIFGLEKNKDLKELQYLKKLKELTILNCSDLNNINVLAALPNFEELRIGGKNKLTNKSMTALGTLKKLKRLHLDDVPVDNLKPLENLDKLEFIIIDSPEINNLDYIKNLKALRHIVLSSGKISNISGISKLENLEYLNLFKNTIRDISPVSELKNLKNIVLDSNNISDIKPLSGLSKLESISITNNKITDISPLSKLTNLEDLYLQGNKIKDFGPIASYYKLLSNSDFELK